jgi:peptide alpha-N-acetyltransferase
MLAVDENYRKRKIGGTLVKKAIEAMIADTVDEVVLETEVTNKVALRNGLTRCHEIKSVTTS